MKLRIADNQRSVIVKLGIGCVVCLLLGFGVLLHAQEKTKTDFIGTKSDVDSVKKPEMDPAKIQKMEKIKEQAETQRNRFRQRQNRASVDFGENAAFYKVIIDNNLFRPLGWTPPNNEPAYSLIGTAVDADGVIAQATLLEKRSNRYHFVTIGEKLGDITVKDIQAKQVILEKDGKPITLKTETLQFLATSRGSGNKGDEGREGGSEKDGSNAAQNQANAKQRQMEAEKRRQMEMKEQAAALGINQKELAEKLRNASPEERQEIMREIRRRAAGRRAGNRGRSNRNR